MIDSEIRSYIFSNVPVQNKAELNGRIVSIYNDILRLDRNEIDSAVTKIFSEFEKVEKDKYLIIQRKKEFPYQILVAEDTVYCLRKGIGQGTCSTVYEAIMIAMKEQVFESHTLYPGDWLYCALKISKTAPFGQIKRKTDKLSFSTSGIDIPLRTYEGVEGNVSVHKKFDSDLLEFNFHIFPHPVHRLLKSLIGFILPIIKLHDHGYIHRDIKGENLLLDFVENHEALTDIDDLSELSEVTNVIKGTPEYWDSWMFGTPKESLLNQKKGWGQQTKAADIFAFGVTIIKNVLLKFITHASWKPGENEIQIDNILKDLPVEVSTGEWNEDKLKEMGKQFPRRAKYSPLTSTRGKISQFPKLSDYRSELKKCVQLLECFQEGEKRALIEIVDLACDMQEEPFLRPDARKVLEILRASLEKLENYPKGTENKRKKFKKDHVSTINVLFEY